MKHAMILILLIGLTGCMSQTQRENWFKGLAMGTVCSVTLGPVSPLACPGLFYAHAELTADDEVEVVIE